jgi:hypothetical protein
MKAKYTRRSNWTAAIGIAAHVLGVWLFLECPGRETLAYWLLVIGGGFIVVGSCFLAQAKGYPTALGLLSLFFCFTGLFVLFLLPDRCTQGEMN